MRDQGDHAHPPSPDSAPQARQAGTPADPALPQRTPAEGPSGPAQRVTPLTDTALLARVLRGLQQL